MLTVIKLILLFIGFSSTTKGGIVAIKYEVFDNYCHPDMDKCRTEFTQEAVINKKSVAMIKIVEELPILRKGMLQIIASTRFFYIDNANLTEIEPGAFDGQNITYKLNIVNTELTIIRSGTFKNFPALILFLSSNKIAHIEDRAISDMPNLTAIYLSENNIVHISVNSFVNVPQLIIFDLSSNKVTKLDEKCFDFMASRPSEISINLNHNLITEIHPKAFDGNMKFWILSLNNNNSLAHVPDGIWTARIVALSLANNQLEELPTSFYSSNISRVYLEGNPLKCEEQEKLKDEIIAEYKFDEKCQ